MNIANYWHDIDDWLEVLVRDGFTKLPPLDCFDLESYAKKINLDRRGATFEGQGTSHRSFIEHLSLDSILAPRLFDIAKSLFGYRGDISDQYHVARFVEPGNKTEMYRAHFDSHIFTLVLPILIPTAGDGGTTGDLVFFPKLREPPAGELRNLFEKAYYKKFASESGLKRLARSNECYRESFHDYSPLLFIGNTTLHTNLPVSIDCSGPRLTLLAHFFDPSPKYGVGSAMRKFRDR